MPRKVARAVAVGTVADASMRPGLLCPGRRAAAMGSSCVMGSFNEAGAVMPRKGAGGGGGLPRRPGASMRPGLLCPGRWGGQVMIIAWLLGFNEAGAVMPRKMAWRW